MKTKNKVRAQINLMYDTYVADPDRWKFMYKPRLLELLNRLKSFLLNESDNPKYRRDERLVEVDRRIELVSSS